MSLKILLVEDDENMRFMLHDNLEMAGYSVRPLGDGQTALSAFMKEEFDLCIIDVMLPKKDGFTLATDIRKLNQQIPIVFLTARNVKEDRIHGFRIGADDYITKPFSLEEFLLRIEAILKRVYRTPTKADEQFTYPLARFTFHFNQQKIIKDDRGGAHAQRSKAAAPVLSSSKQSDRTRHHPESHLGRRRIFRRPQYGCVHFKASKNI
jgi:two-component system OmpR family response regulator